MKKLIFFFLVIYSSNLIAQYPDWKYYSKAGDINAIAQDGNYIWVGTQVGVTKIDKNTGYKVYFDKTNCPLPDSWVSQIAVDNNGTKWFGTWDKGYIIKFDNVNWTIYDTSNSLLPGHSIASLAIDSSNNLWISTGWTTDGLIKFDGVNWTIYNTTNSGLPSNGVGNIFCEGTNVWLVSNNELVKFDGINWTIYNSSNSNISSNSIVAIDKDNIGNIWLLHYNGVEKFDGSLFTVFDNSNTNIPNINNYSMTIDANNVIWTGCITYNYSPQVLGGIMSFDGNTWTKYDTTNSQVNDITISPVYADNSDNIWFGCDNIGMIGRKNGSTYTYYDPSESGLDYSNVQQTVFNQNGTAFIITNSQNISMPGEELVKYNWSNWTELVHYNSFEILGMAIDLSGNLYLKIDSGLEKYDGTNWTNIPNTPALQSGYPVSLYLNTITTDLSGGVWMDYLDRVSSYYDGSGNWYYYSHEGLAYYNGINWTKFNSLNSPLPDANINCIEVDASNHIWIGTDSGLVKYDGINWTIYNTSNSLLPSNYFGTFIIDSLNNIWFPNGHYGFYKFEWTGLIDYTHPTLNSYLASGPIARDIDGSMWQITGFDLIHFDGTNWETFNADNSPVPNIFDVTSLSIDKYGNKWIGTQFGFLVYKKGGVVTSTELAFQDHLITVFPNPTSNNLTIVTPQNAVIEITNIQGQLIKTFAATGNKTNIDVSALPGGVYVMEVRTEKGVEVKKFVKE